MAEVKRTAENTDFAFSLSFSKKSKLGFYRKLIKKAEAEIKHMKNTGDARFAAASETFPRVKSLGVAAIKTIENEKYFSDYAELWKTARDIFDAGCAADMAGFLSERMTGDGYPSIFLSLLPSAVVLCAVKKYTQSFDDAAKIYDAAGIFGVFSSGVFAMLPEKLCCTSRILCAEKADVFRFCSDETKGVYIRAVAECAYRSGVGEAAYARETVAEADRRKIHVGEILLKKDGFAGRVYFILLFAFTFIFTALFALTANAGKYTLPVALLLVVPVYEFVKQFIRGFFVDSGKDKIPVISSVEKLRSHKTVIVIPALFRDDVHDGEIFERMEDHFLTNGGENYIFAVLFDFRPADKKTLPDDEARVRYAKRRTDALNKKYKNRFALFFRERRFCKSENAYMGRERKRGAVTELCLFLHGGKSDIVFYGDADISGTEYLLTLDEDTKLNAGAADGLLGAMIHPMNKPVIDEKKGIVKRGYAIVAPKTNISLESATATRFAAVYSGEGGLDIYSGTSFDIYQDLFGAGSFCGKGMIDIAAFCAVIPGFFPRGRILSHDLLEGCLLSCALFHGMALGDDAPTDFSSFYSRKSRWIRGDVQALPYARSHVTKENGEKIKNPMSALSRYKIADNLLRASAPFFLVASLFVSVFAGVKAAALAAVFASLYLIFPFFDAVLHGGTSYFSKKFIPSLLFKTFIFVSGAAHEACVFLRAFFISFYRMNFSKKHLLEWQTAAESAAAKKGMRGIFLSLFPSAVIGVAALFLPSAAAKIYGFLFLCYPIAVFVLSKTPAEAPAGNEKIKGIIKSYARDMWRYFSLNICEKTNYLPPDNYQISPEEKTAMRTSPTNIGLYLLSLMAARDFGFIDSEKLHFYAKKSGESIEKLLSWHGHLYNWYDISSLSVLGEAFVSSVDSGNFTASLVAFCEGLREYISECPKLADDIAMYEKMISRADFSALYSPQRKCFYIGYNATGGYYTNSYYDTFMSEFRITHYYATAAGYVPPESYFSLSRLAIKSGGRVGFASWSGTAFEYFMPALLLPHKKGSLSRAALDFAFYIQEHTKTERELTGHTHHIYGISESGYYNFDAMMNYQYKAFGIPKLALDPAAEGESCVSPYSSFLMLEYGTGSVLSNLRELTALGMYGKFGFYEALDADRTRVGGGYAVIRSYMAHHLGMSIVACANFCFDKIFVRRFMRNAAMRASRELLCERIPEIIKCAPARIYTPHEKPSRPEFYEEETISQEKHSIISPEFALASNNKSRIIASSSGHIALYDGREAIAISDFDMFSLGGGFRAVFYIDDKIYFPYPLGACDIAADKYEFVHNSGKAEYISHYETDAGIRKIIFTAEVLPNREIFRFTAKIEGEYKKAAVMLYFEPIMTEEKTYRAHKSFENLFIESRFCADEKILLFSRRPRNDKKPFRYLGIKAAGNTAFSFATKRDEILPLFYSDRDIALLSEKEFQNTDGAVIIPVCAVKAEMKRGENRAEFLIGCFSNEEDLLFELSAYRHPKKENAMREVARLQYFAAGYRKEVISSEKYILSSIFMPKTGKHNAGAALPDILEKHPPRQSELWKYGISGENPIILACVGGLDENKKKNLEMLFYLFRYMCIRGIRYEFVILHAEKDLYRRDVEKQLYAMAKDCGVTAFIGAENGIFTVNENSLSEKMLYFLKSLSGLCFDCTVSPEIYAASYTEDMEISDDFAKELQKTAQTKPLPSVYGKKSESAEDVGTGSFHENGFAFHKPHTGMPYAHVLANEAFGTVVSENSAGFTFFTNSVLRRLTPHNADNMLEDSGEKLILRIFGSVHKNDDFADYDLIACAANVDYTFDAAYYYGTVRETDYSVKISVCGRFPVKKIEVSLFPKCTELLYCTVYYFAVPDMGVPRSMLRFKGGKNEIYIYNLADYGGGKWNMCISAENRPGCRIYTDKTEIKSGEKLSLLRADIAALAVKTALAGEENITFYLGVNGAHRYLSKSSGHDETKNFISLFSGDVLFDITVNKWFLYQTKVCRLFARAGFYQTGGAWGFRDQLQDTLSLLSEEPQYAKYQIIRAAAHQFEEGDVLHWWHSVRDFSHDDCGVRTRCSDDMLWLPFAVAAYLRVTGDEKILGTEVKYLSSPPLSRDEHERYERVSWGNVRENIYMHCLRAIRHFLGNIGSHGLAKIGGGDWNDGMNGVGGAGKGESVWLSQFAAIVLYYFSDVCRMRGDTDTARLLCEKSAALRSAAFSCFENDRFLRGYYDNGDKLGSYECDECKIDAISQAFAAFDALLPDASEDEKKKAALAVKTAREKLFSERYKLYRLLTPPFVSGKNSPGYIKGYVAGIRENGGQYTHAAVWAAMGLLAAGDYDEGARMLFEINPALRLRDGFLRDKYKIEPYVMAGDVYVNHSCMGRGGWSWYTGASGWYRTAVICFLCGYRQSVEYFTLRPCLSDYFDAFSLSVNVNGTKYSADVRAGDKDMIILDGERIFTDDIFDFRFYFNGGEHEVKFTVKR